MNPKATIKRRLLNMKLLASELGVSPVFIKRMVRGLIAKRAVRTTVIVFDTPAFQDNVRLLQIAEEFAVKAFIAQLVVKAFNMPVFPRAPRLDVERLDLLGLQPVLDAVGDKLGPVVAAQVFGHSIAGYGRFHHRYDVDGPDRPRRMNG
jgi:hypothetical protein